MIDETDVVTYKSDNCARIELTWVAYVVLPNGEYWGVRFNGATEEIAKTKAISTWNAEKDKYKRLEPNEVAKKASTQYVKDQIDNDPWANVPSGRGHHFAGKIWMRHKDSRELIRVPLTEIMMWEGKGYERSGPRSK